MRSVPVKDTDDLVSKWCNQGAAIEYVRDTFGEHDTEAFAGDNGAFAWLSDRLSGKAVSGGCVTKNVTLGL